MTEYRFLKVAEDLEVAGLFWAPEVGDEVADREEKKLVSILVDPQGMTPGELRSTYIWLPSVEQMIFQVEARKALLFHAGFEYNDQSCWYKTVLQGSHGQVEARADNFRTALGLALRGLLLSDNKTVIN